MNMIQAIKPGMIQSVTQQAQPTSPTGTMKNFGEMLSDAIQSVNNDQNTASMLTNRLVTGEIQDVHQVMIAAQKASVSLQLTVQVRNKVVEAYQDIMRMQM